MSSYRPITASHITLRRSDAPRDVFSFDSGELVDAALSPRTKETLQQLAGRRFVDAKQTALAQSQTQKVDELPEQKPSECSRRTGNPNSDSPSPPRSIQMEVPLRHNDEFFQILQYGLSGLNSLYDQEKTVLVRDIGDLSHRVSQVAVPSRHVQQTDLYAWRAIFELYLECSVFFSASEEESFYRSPAEAQKQLQLFSTRLDALQKTKRFRKKESSVALQRFLLINANLLRNLKFQQLNVRAAGKILKSK
ncbi:MAG: hypothetical protein LQ338_003876 [Usnochroma carphineum]|nr:MAG: hypothetical protein LQ338_003876 [Usnochroma carphineum]